MRIKSLETAGFGNLRDGVMEIEEGLTAVVGANEKGKTFTWLAIVEGLYGDGTTTNTDIKVDARKWGCEGAFLVRLVLEHNGGTYVVTRDYGEKKNLMLLPDGSELKDKKKISAVITAMTGLPSDKSYEATASIPQDGISKVSGEASLRQLIEERVAGAGTAVDPLIKKIEKVRKVILSDNKKRGTLYDQSETITALETGLETRNAALQALVEDKLELARVSESLVENQRQLQSSEGAYEGSKKYIKARRDCDSADAALTSALEKQGLYKQAVKDITESTGAISELEESLGALSQEIKGAEDLDKARGVLEGLQEEKNALGNRIARISEKDKEIREADQALRSLALVDPSELRNAKALPVEIDGLSSVLAGQVFSIDIRPESDGVKCSILADGQEVPGLRADVHGEAAISFPGVASVHVKNMTGEGEPLVDEIKRKKAVLEGILKKYGVGLPEELERLHADRREAAERKGRLEKDRAGLLSGDDLAELEASVRELEERMGQAAGVVDGLKANELPPERLEEKKAIKVSAEAEKARREDARNRARGVLQVTGEDEAALSAAVKEAAKRLAVAEASLEQHAPFQCTPEDYAELENRVNGLREEVRRLTELKAVLSDRLSRETVSEEDVAELQEQLEEARRVGERLSRKYEVLGIILENIAAARKGSLEGFSDGIEQRMGEIISRITGGRYSEVRVDGNLGVSVFSVDKGEYISLDKNVPLSTGTIDQLYLAARLGILEVIAGKCRPPVLMDDTFSDFDDMGRKHNAFEVLEEMAGEFQVLYFTCHEVPEGVRKLEIV